MFPLLGNCGSGFKHGGTASGCKSEWACVKSLSYVCEGDLTPNNDLINKQHASDNKQHWQWKSMLTQTWHFLMPSLPICLRIMHSLVANRLTAQPLVKNFNKRSFKHKPSGWRKEFAMRFGIWVLSSHTTYHPLHLPRPEWLKEKLLSRDQSSTKGKKRKERLTKKISHF